MSFQPVTQIICLLWWQYESFPVCCVMLSQLLSHKQMSVLTMPSNQYTYSANHANPTSPTSYTLTILHSPAYPPTSHLLTILACLLSHFSYTDHTGQHIPHLLMHWQYWPAYPPTSHSLTIMASLSSHFSYSDYIGQPIPPPFSCPDYNGQHILPFIMP